MNIFDAERRDDRLRLIEVEIKSTKDAIEIAKRVRENTYLIPFLESEIDKLYREYIKIYKIKS